jgi:histone demethylase JARID1
MHEWIPYGVDADERYRMFGRLSVFSMARLLFTLLHYVTAPSIKNAELVKAARTVLEEEVQARPHLISLGVRSVASIVKMPGNNFTVIDKAAMDYDDRRVCCVCKCVCIFSAVACECNNSRVACIRHESYMCKCAK